MKNEDVTSHLMKQANSIAQGADLLANTINDWQLIRKYLTNRIEDIELSQVQQKKLERYNFIYDQLATGNYTDKEVVTLVSERFSVSIRQAYEDIACSKEVYTHVFNFNKGFELRLQLDLNREMLKRAKEKGDMKNYAMLEKNRVKLMEMMPDLEEAENWFEPHELVIEFNPSLIGAPPVDMQEVLKYINEKRKAKIKTELFEEIKIEPDGN